jgi:hypothetical protein
MKRRVSLSAAVSMLLGLIVLPITSIAGLGNIEIPSSKAGNVEIPSSKAGNVEIPSSKAGQLQGGEIMPPSARPFGFSLSDMAAADAQFVTSGNSRPELLPTTPFQILYFDPNTINVSPVQGNGLLETGSKSFPVPAGTMFYVPIATVDDTPTVIGTFPTSPSTARSYWFGSSQLGGSDSITVDGRTTPIGATYLVGPITTQPLQDGGGMPGGTHIITMGVFLTAFSKGTHTVSVRTRFDGDLILQFLGINFLDGEFTYNVTVQ